MGRGVKGFTPGALPRAQRKRPGARPGLRVDHRSLGLEQTEAVVEAGAEQPDVAAARAAVAGVEGVRRQHRRAGVGYADDLGAESEAVVVVAVAVPEQQPHALKLDAEVVGPGVLDAGTDCGPEVAVVVVPIANEPNPVRWRD